MSVAPTVTAIVQPARRERRNGAITKVLGPIKECVVGIEDHLFDATAELVYQEVDLTEAASPENNSLLERALAVEGLPALARELIAEALRLEREEDAAILRALARRDAAHGSNRRAIGGCEALLTGKGAAS